VTQEQQLRDQITGVVLAGGMGRRMDGVDKGLVSVAGTPMIARVIDVLRDNLAHIIVNANRNEAEYQSFGVRIVADSRAGYQGPLAGIEAAMAAAETDWIFTCPCDSPLQQPGLLPHLWRQRQLQDADIALAHDGQRTHPVFSIIRTELLQSLRDYLGAGERKIDRWFARHHHIEVDCSEFSDSFVNINTDADKARVESFLENRRGTI